MNNNDELLKLGPEDPGHLLPGDVWEQVVRDIESDELETHRDALVLASASPNVDKFVQAVSHGGNMGHDPYLLVVHDVESPLKAGYAASLAGPNWFGGPQAGTSAHYIIDPSVTIQMVHTYDIAWHVGPKANGFTLGYEQAGYSKFTRAQWLTPEGIVQMKRLARLLVEDAKAYNIPLRWATDQQIRDAAALKAKGGICRHMDITRVLGGTTHGDPGNNYPKDRLAAEWTAIVHPAPTPTPVPKPTPGGSVDYNEFYPLMDRWARERRATDKNNPHPATLFEVLDNWHSLFNRVTAIYDADVPADLAALKQDMATMNETLISILNKLNTPPAGPTPV